MLHNKILSQIFDKMADLYLLRGFEEDRYRISTYRRVAQMLRYYPKDVSELDQHQKLQDIPGVGPAISEKIHEYLKSGTVKTYEQLRGEFPEGLLALLEIPSLGPKKVQMLWKSLGVVDRKTLETVLKNGEAEKLPGFGKKSVDNILRGISLGEKIQKRKFLGEVFPLMYAMKSFLQLCPDVVKVEPCGSFRRGEETIGDLDILISSKNPKKVAMYFVNNPAVKEILAHGDTKASVILQNNYQIDLRVVHPDEWGSALQYFTGSKSHNVHLRTIAREKHMTVNEYGVFRLTKAGEKGNRVAGKTEQNVYHSLGIQYIPPEMRTDTGEIEAAMKKRKLPELIALSDLKGDLHVHTVYSDGIHTIEAMAKKADELGLEYMALTDHSPSLKVAHGLDVRRLEAKRKEMESVQMKVKVKLLMGTEVDILADGSLDYPDAVLKNFDVVVASIHAGFSKDNTSRILKVMDNPYVTIIGHVSGRMFGKREGYPIDYDVIFKKAATTNTWIEINSQPERQDISWDHIRKGKEMGVKFVISTDSHSKDTLWYRELGVVIARRGWLTKDDVVNTLSKNKFLEVLRKH